MCNAHKTLDMQRTLQMLNVIFGVLQPIALHCIALVEGFGVEVAEQTALDNEAKYLTRRLQRFLDQIHILPTNLQAHTSKHLQAHPSSSSGPHPLNYVPLLTNT